ncbi:MAG: hypothetical protein ACYCYM_03235 [Saccharofermentanales bacterium]
MKNKKILALLLTVSLVFSVFASAAITVNASLVQTVVPAAPEGRRDDPNRLMYPGYTHWMNFADMSSEWGTGLDMTEHVWSDFADQGDMASRYYIQLDREMQATSTAAGKAGYRQGLFKTDNATYYRDLLWFGTFQGVRIDYASFGKNADARLDYTVYPGAYVSTALLLSSYWMNVAGGDYANLWLKAKIQTSADGTTWVDVAPENINFFWEHGNAENTEPVNAYATCITTIKMPDDHMYYRVRSPYFSGMDPDAAALGPTKVSVTSMADGATGDPTVSSYYAPASADERILEFDVWTSKMLVKTIDTITVEVAASYISLSAANGSAKFFTAGDVEITDLQTVLANGMKLKVYDSANSLMLTNTIEYAAPDTVTISPSAPKKALNPGVVDNGRLDPIPGQNLEWNNYSDYASKFDAAKPLSATKVGERFFGTFFGTPNYGGYRAWTPATGIGVMYRVVPGSFISTSLLLHTSLISVDGKIDSEAVIKDTAKKFKVFTSADGVTWVEYVLQDADLTPEHGLTGWGTSWNGNPAETTSGFASVRACTQVPAGHRYYMVEFPTYYGGDFCYIGGSKASSTDMHGTATGDASISWYALPEVVSNDFASVLLNEATGTLTAMAEGSMTLQQIKDKLLITEATVKFFTAADVEITDLATNVTAGMKMKTYDAEVLLNTFTIDAQIVLPPEEPGVEVGDAQALAIDDVNGKINLIGTGMTLQEILDALILKGDVVPVFSDADGNEITDLSTVAEEGMYLAIYTTVLFAEYELAFADESGNPEESETPENSENPQSPETGDQTSPFAPLIAVLALAAISAAVYKKRAQVR